MSKYGFWDAVKITCGIVLVAGTSAWVVTMGSVWLTAKMMGY